MTTKTYRRDGDIAARPRDGEVIICIGNGTLSFAARAAGEGDNAVRQEPYVVKSGISMAANLREAFHMSALLTEGFRYARMVADAPYMLVPAAQYEEAQAAELFFYTFPKLAQYAVLNEPLEELGVVVLFGIHKDLKLVMDDHFEEVTFTSALTPVWRQFHRHSVTGVRNRLYAYFHEKRLDVFGFQKSRFRFCNQFDADNADDALYYLLYVWKQLMLKADHDELFIIGQLPRQASSDDDRQQWFTDELRKYIGRVELLPGV